MESRINVERGSEDGHMHRRRLRSNMAKHKKPDLRPHADLIRILADKRYSKKLKQRLLQEAPSGTICKLCECVFNVLKGVVPLNNCQKRKLTPTKQVLRKIVQPGLTLPQQRQALVKQTGKALPLLALLPSLLGAFM